MNNNKGFTLIETVMSIVLLGIIIASILPLIGNSVVTIIESGIRDQAVTTATNFTEMIHQEVILRKSEIPEEDWESFKNKTVYFKKDKVDIEYKNSFTFNSTPNNNKLLFSKEKTDGGYRLKVVFFYNKGEEQIELNSFVSFKRG